MATFTMENTDGYTPEDLVQFNIEEDAILAEIEPGSAEYHAAVQAFQHEISRRSIRRVGIVSPEITLATARMLYDSLDDLLMEITDGYNSTAFQDDPIKQRAIEGAMDAAHYARRKMGWT
jgi:hypothetical protein